MKIRYFIFATLVVAIVCVTIANQIEIKDKQSKHKENQATNKLIEDIQTENKHLTNKYPTNNELDLYAKSACVYDTVAKRVLYNKDGDTKLPMASTTKIMTCIIALESPYLDKNGVVSSYAASMPNVQLNIVEGEILKIRDMLYSLMLESHNDIAVAIAENIAAYTYGRKIITGDKDNSKELVGLFASMMNKKAKDLGLKNTSFVTPNGLDADNHYTTAAELAVIGAYAIDNEDFIKITNSKNYTLTSYKNKDKEYGKTYEYNIIPYKRYTVSNRNAFLSQYPGAIGIKTGYTGKAGYCFVGAIHKEEYRLVSSVLASGWSPHKNYKWSDTRKLMEYVTNNYRQKNIHLREDDVQLNSVYVRQSTIKKKVIKCSVELKDDINMLLSSKDKLLYEVYIPKELVAPVRKKEIVGVCKVYLNNNQIKNIKIYSKENIDRITYIDMFKEGYNKIIFGR